MSFHLSPLHPASSVLLVRDEPCLQVLMVHRHAMARVVPGAMVFPGGRVDRQDHAPEWARYADGWVDAPPEERAYRVAAVRELFEETGILLARHGDGKPFTRAFEAARRRADLNSGATGFLDLVREGDLRIDLGVLVPFSIWRTPPVVPLRFDTLFFIARAPAFQLAQSDGSETVGAEWIAPADALRLAAAGERNVVLPTRMNLHQLGAAGRVEEAISAARARRIEPIEPRVERRSSGVHLVLDPKHGFGDVAEPFTFLHRT